MNECHFIGNLVGRPVLSDIDLPDGRKVAVARFTLCVKRRHKNSQGESSERKQYLDFEVWDSAAETISKNCRPGELLIIEKSSACSYTDENSKGDKINRIYFRVDKFAFQSSVMPPRKVYEDDSDDE